MSNADRGVHKDLMGKSYTIVFVCDTHLTYVSDPSQLHPAMRLVWKFITNYRPEVVIIGGDYLDMTPVSPHAMKAKNHKELETARLQKDYNLGRALLEQIRPRVVDMKFLEGNHEFWIERFLETYPQFTGMLEVKTGLGLDALDIQFYGVNTVLSYGKLNFTHGWYTNKYHARKHLDEMGDHIIYGHTHDHQKHAKPVRASRAPYLAMSMGCLCNLNPYYMRNRPSNWLHGFGLIEVETTGNFAAHFIPIIDKSFIWDRFQWRL